MKKYLILFITFIVVIASLMLTKYYINKNTVQIEIYKVKTETIKIYVECGGKIEALSKKEIFADSSLYVKNVNVSLGQKVKSGEMLANIDTSKAPKTNNSISGLPGIEAFNPNTVTNNTQDSINVTDDKVTSPLKGIVTEINVSGGSYINLSKPMFVICDLSSLIVRALIPENQISMLKKGQSAIVNGTGFKGKSYNGVIESINPVAKDTIVGTTSQTAVEAVLKISDPDQFLKPGFNADVKILADQKDNIISIPYETIVQDNENREYVYIYSKGRINKRYIKSGLESENSVEVEGLSPNDLIVFNPAETLYDGQKVKVKVK